METKMTTVRDARFGALKMIVEDKIMVKMRDGVNIACRIYRPDAPGKYPALFAASPYQFETDDIPHSTLFLWREVGPVEWYVSHGYAYVHMDVRGSGHSDGSYEFLSPAEQRDYFETIEWIARQPWCDGKVGGCGQSYYAWSQWFMGIVNPPSLKCIAPYDGSIDIYRDVAYHGGVYGDFMNWWFNLMVRPNNSHRAANAQNGNRMRYDLGWDFTMRQTYDDWWKARSAIERIKEIKVPVLSIGHQGKMGLHERGNILGYEELDCPKKLILTGAKDAFEAHDLFDKIEVHEQWLKPFYDYYLKGLDNDYPSKTPDVQLFMRGADKWISPPAWPVAQASLQPWYLRKGPTGSVNSLNDGGLSPTAPGADEGATRYSYPDPKWHFGVAALGPQGPDPLARNLTFTSEALTKEVQIAGCIVLELYVVSTNIDTDFFVKLSDQFPQSSEDRAKGLQPSYTNVAKGWLRASHREKDEQRSTPQRPYYKHTNPQPIEPGKVYKYDIEIWPAVHCFRTGHRIRLDIAIGDTLFTDSFFTHQYFYYKVGTDTYFHNAIHASRLILPVLT
jgi:putative CocE/NonD family hydrolase